MTKNWTLKGNIRTDTYSGTFNITLKAETLRAAVEAVEAAVTGATVTSIVENVPYSPD